MFITADNSSVIIAKKQLTAIEKSPMVADFYYPLDLITGLYSFETKNRILSEVFLKNRE